MNDKFTVHTCVYMFTITWASSATGVAQQLRVLYGWHQRPYYDVSTGDCLFCQSSFARNVGGRRIPDWQMIAILMQLT